MATRWIAPQVRSLEELATSKWDREEAEIVLKYKDVVKQALLNAMKRARSCVLRYEYIYKEIYALIEDEDETWRVENAIYAILDGLKIDDIVAYKIYVDEDESIYDVFVVVFNELSNERIKMLEEIATLFATRFYYKFHNKEKVFYDATPIGAHERDEVYVTLHNLVCMWTYCCLEEEE